MRKRLLDKNIRIYKSEYFAGKNPMYIAKKYGENYLQMKKYLTGSATKNYTDQNGVIWRRCIDCGQYKKNETYFSQGEKKYPQQKKSYCAECSVIRGRNLKIYKKNIDEHYDYIYWEKKYHYKYGWRRNFRRRILKIIGYLDYNGRVLGEKIEYTKKRQI